MSVLHGEGTDATEALIDAAFATVSRNPSDYEAMQACRTAVRAAVAGDETAARAALLEVSGWIANWDPAFTEDEEWAPVAARIRQALGEEPRT